MIVGVPPVRFIARVCVGCYPPRVACTSGAGGKRSVVVVLVPQWVSRTLGVPGWDNFFVNAGVLCTGFENLLVKTGVRSVSGSGCAFFVCTLFVEWVVSKWCGVRESEASR